MALNITAAVDVEAAAARLRRAYYGPPLSPLRKALGGASIADAYAIQSANTAYWLGQGRRRVGAKIGLTAKSVQAQLGVDQPDFGTLFADMGVCDGGTVPAGRLIQPKVEAEVAFRLARPVDVSRLSLVEIAGAVACAMPAIEIVDSRIENWDIGIVDTVADNASSGLFVLGENECPLSAINLEHCRMTLTRDGEVVSTGTGAACLGNPLNALGWLARTMAEFGAPLGAGDIVLAGALGPMVAALPGDAFTATIAGLGPVSVRFAA